MQHPFTTATHHEELKNMHDAFRAIATRVLERKRMEVNVDFGN
jgi:hypothetical protein